MKEVRFIKETKQALTLNEFIDLNIAALPNEGQLESIWLSYPIVTIGYDSEAETRKHIARVNELMIASVTNILERATLHDASKLSEKEKPLFDKMTPILKGLVFGSDEYKASTDQLKPALDNHYAENSHHPQHYENGVSGMDLFDLVEMMCDWKAAGERHKDGDIIRSIEINTGRLEISEQLAKILMNHAERYLL